MTILKRWNYSPRTRISSSNSGNKWSTSKDRASIKVLPKSAVKLSRKFRITCQKVCRSPMTITSLSSSMTKFSRMKMFNVYLIHNSCQLIENKENQLKMQKQVATRKNQFPNWSFHHRKAAILWKDQRFRNYKAVNQNSMNKKKLNLVHLIEVKMKS